MMRDAPCLEAKQPDRGAVTVGPTSTSLSVTVLSADDAYDYQLQAAQLAAPLAGSVAIRVFRIPFLAVPVGGPRHGGFYLVPDAGDHTIGTAVCAALSGLHGFPQLRARWAPAPDYCYVIEWGAEPPTDHDEAVRARFYGYSEQAIRAGRFTLPPPPRSRVPGSCT
ncbi:DUF6302 family protein [Streptomyces sp. NPDC058280]|uniref:DUF6302 family protein n=1 Tax=Streptomyces sp. NPDC058280 TaxID=3346419 RepID=UPI0036E8BFA7